MKYKNNRDIKIPNGDGTTFLTCKDGKRHNWIFNMTRRIGYNKFGPEDMYMCTKCEYYAYATQINYPILSHGDY